MKNFTLTPCVGRFSRNFNPFSDVFSRKKYFLKIIPPSFPLLIQILNATTLRNSFFTTRFGLIIARKPVFSYELKLRSR